MEKVEIVDIASRKTIDTFTLSEGNKKVRIRSLEPDPLHRFVMMVTASATKLIDRFEIGAPTLMQYDLATHKVVRTIPWPNGEERENANILFSPDGKLMYLFSDQDVLIYDTDDLQAGGQVGAVAADRGRLRPPRVRLARRHQRRARLLHRRSSTCQDPVQHRRIMGIGRVNLAAKTRRLLHRSARRRGSASRWRRAARRPTACSRRSAATSSGRSISSTGSSRSRTEFEGRPRMALKTSSNGKVLYIYDAGNTIDLYDAATYQYLRTITLDGDMTTDLFVLPAEASSA